MARNRESKIELTAYDDLFETDESRAEANLSKIREIPIAEIDEFPDHPFKVLMDEDMEQLVDSVRRSGVMTPATVRQKEDGRYELISGHRRKKACELAGLETLKCEVKELTRDEAIIVMVESNLQRTTILPSEKAFAYKMRLEAMDRQGQRVDLTSTPVVSKSRSNEELADRVGESREQIRRFIRLTELVPEILQMVDERQIAFRPAVEISYLSEEQQYTLLEAMGYNDATPSLAQAIKMKKFMQEGIILIVVLLGCAVSLFGGGSDSTSYTPVSAEVEAYTPLIQKYAKQYGIPEYVELIKAVMMQESGGKGSDPMQAAEESFNKRYPHEPNGIKDPEYSIECGVQELKAALVSAEVENPIDMERIKLALQGYNFGNGYISWAKTNYGGYSYANAVEFSAMQAQRLGWEKYGDTQYPAHVLRYYPYGRAFTSRGNQAIVEVALTQLGNEGGQPYWSWYGFGGRVEWCACFASWCADQCGYLESGIIPKFSLCSDGVNWFKGKGQWQDKNYEPQAGDLIFFDWGSDGSIDHVGIVEKCENGTVYTVEGNSGDACKQQSYPVGSSSIYGYGCPAY